MRNWLNDVRSYIEPVQLGNVMRAVGIGRVIATNSSEFKAGDLVSVIKHPPSTPARIRIIHALLGDASA